MVLNKALPGLGIAAFFAAAAAILCTLPGAALPGVLGMGLVLSAAFFGALAVLRPEPGKALYFTAVPAALLLLARLFFFPVETSDFRDFLLPWTERLRALGGFRGLGREIGNYNVPYMVLLVLFSYLKTPALYLIKLSSVLFELLQAVVLALLVRRLGGGKGRVSLCFVLALALPTVFLNSAVWGQCDSVYVSLALLGFYLCLAERPGWGMAALGLSFAFKLQAVFLLPAVLLLLFAGKVKWFHLPLFPAAYALAVSPALIAGRSAGDTFLFYLRTASTAGSALNYNSPSLFSLYRFYWMDEAAKEAAARMGILAAFGLCLLVFVLFFLRRKAITLRSLLFAVVLFTLGIPLLLPHMHDRYFYFCDVLTLCAACLVPCFSPAVLLSQFASLLGYHAYFYLRYLLPMRLGFLALCAVFLAAMFLCARELIHPPADESVRSEE
ncbi:MAG: DUF2029 domain-containing protein [Oscillospiraceae bacterium]|nr:DUF2029 domain-containing protein [Oscillospiraceae bacterium]